MASGSRRRQQEINDEATKRNIDPGTGGTGSGADMESTNLDTPVTTVRGRHPDGLPGRDPRSHRQTGVDDDRPNAGDASDKSSFDASDAYTGIDSDDALASGEGGGGSS